MDIEAVAIGFVVAAADLDGDSKAFACLAEMQVALNLHKRSSDLKRKFIRVDT